MLLSRWPVCALAALLAGSSTAATTANATVSSFNASCVALAASLALDNATVLVAEYVAAGTTLRFPNNNASCSASFAVTSNICRVGLNVTTSSRSGFIMEAWLPLNWTGRFLSTGNSALGGCIQYTDINYANSQGFAAIGTDNGHNGMRAFAFLNNPDVIEDFSYRALHTGTVLGKQITESLYGVPHKKSYYLGCSTGGRQGFKSAQDFPDDFDGIVAGAPAISMSNFTAWGGHLYLTVGPSTSASFLPAALWSTVHTEVLNQCDLLDGYADGIIEDPDLCQFRPEALICNPGNTTNCLSPAQVATVRTVFSGWYGLDGGLMYPRMQPGSELGDVSLYYNGNPVTQTTDWFRYAIYNDPTWDPSTMSLEDVAYAARKNPSDVDTWNGDLSGFQSAGGKLLHYHGRQDQIISSDNSERYYNRVSDTMSLPSSELDNFYRFFRISGMGHCSGGPGAWEIGQTSSGVSQLTSEDNVLLRIVDWVENGNAPDSVRGTKYVNDKVAQGTAFVRAHCKYPTRNVYSGSGDPTLPGSWNCI